MQTRVIEVDNEPILTVPLQTQARRLEVPNEPMNPTPLASQARRLEVADAARKPAHKARDAVDLADPLFHAMARAERGQAKSMATKEQTLAEMVLKMRLVDAGKR